MLAQLAGTTGKTSDKAPEGKALAPVPQRADIFQPLKRVADEMWPRAWEGRAGPCELVL
jgi:hypothetical protein